MLGFKGQILWIPFLSTLVLGITMLLKEIWPFLYEKWGGMAYLASISLYPVIIYAKIDADRDILEITNMSAEAFPRAQELFTALYTMLWLIYFLFFISIAVFLGYPFIKFVICKIRNKKGACKIEKRDWRAGIGAYIVLLLLLFLNVVAYKLRYLLDDAIVLAAFSKNSYKSTVTDNEVTLCGECPDDVYIHLYAGSNVAVAVPTQDDGPIATSSPRYRFAYGSDCTAACEAAICPYGRP